MALESFGVDQDVIHVYLDYSFVDQFPEKVVHHSLKGGRGVAESEEHDCWFEESVAADESGFVTVFAGNADIVESPPDVEFREEHRFSSVINNVLDVRQWVSIWDSLSIQFSVVLARSGGIALLPSF